MDVEVIGDHDRVRALVPEWSDLAMKTGARAFAFPSWTLACWEASPRPMDVCIVTIRDRGNLIALGAFGELDLPGGRLVRFLGHGTGQTIRNLVAPGHADVEQQIWDALGARPGRFLELLDCENDLTESMGESGRWTTRTRVGHLCFRIIPDVPFEEFLLRKPKKLREQVRSAPRRIARDGLPLEFVHITSLDEHAATLPELSAMLRSEQRTNLRGGPIAEIAGGTLPPAVGALAAAGRVRTVCARVGGQLAGFTTALVGADGVTGYLIGFDPEFARYAPGHLCIGEIVRWAHQEGLREVDLSIGETRFKRLWADEEYTTYDIRAAKSPTRLAVVGTILGLKRRWVASRSRG